MSRLSRAIIVATMALVAPTLAQAAIEQRPIEEKDLVSGRRTLSPDKGYIYLHATGRTTLMLVKEPSAEELAAYEAEWREKFEKAVREFPRRLETWQHDFEMGRVSRAAKPVRPTEQNFSIGRLDQRMIVTLGPVFVYSKGDDSYSYLHELEPGTYRYYGPVLVVPNGVPSGTCYCMGSVKFEVQAGRITNLGDFLTFGWVTPEQGRLSALEWNGSSSARPTDYAMPERLASFPNAIADWRAAEKVDNVYGLMIGRMPPIPGVLAYERDTVIDVKGMGQQGASGAP